MQANGVLAYFTTVVLFFLGWQCKVFSPARVYDLFGEILAALNIFSLLFCLFLYFKVRLHVQMLPAVPGACTTALLLLAEVPSPASTSRYCLLCLAPAPLLLFD